MMQETAVHVKVTEFCENNVFAHIFYADSWAKTCF